ncbi:MAG: helix-turn-helix transcriptional regulator, partial [Lacipirellulaceae bacterium]
MKKNKLDRLEQAGWKVSGAQQLLDLSDEEAALIEMKLSLADSLRKRRTDEGLTQEALAKLLGSSQSRVAKMETADASVSLELL